MLQIVSKQMQKQLRYFVRSAALSSDFHNEQHMFIVAEKVVNNWRKKLNESGVGDIEFNLKCLVAHVLKRKFDGLPDFKELHLNSTQLKDLNRLCEARCARMPLQYLVGEWDFMNITLKTSPSVFIPRPETEEFVHKVIEHYRHVPEASMLEVGCGSGAISLAILHELKQFHSCAIERSRKATALALENAKMLGLHNRFNVYNHTMTKNNYLPSQLVDNTFDLIISNPPYVKSDEFQHLQPEVVSYENLNALDGGQDGLNIARLVFDLACFHLRPGCKVWMELGSGHPPLVKTIINLQYKGKLKYISHYNDQYGCERFVEIEKV